MSVDRRSISLPISLEDMLDADFIAYRAKLLEVAAFLDRCDRLGEQNAALDPRLDALKACLPILSQSGPTRAKRILEQLSDASLLPVAESPGGAAKGAPSF